MKFDGKYELPFSYLGLDDDKKYSFMDLCEIVNDTTSELNNLKKEYEEYRNYVESNYERMTMEKQTSISNNDFI
jgi:hypothetical protein